MIKLAPSLLCANQLNLERDITALINAGADMFHIDVMDGHFVPNLGFTMDTIKQIKAFTRIPLDIHLMVDNPQEYINLLKEVKVDYISFHLEAVKYPRRLLQLIRATGIKAGLAISPKTNVDFLPYLLDYLDYVLIMAIEPGFSGQNFIPQMGDKILAVKKIIDKKGLNIHIEVDGDVNKNTAPECIKNGADILVAGMTSVFMKGIA